jgi:hypothetical protein
MNRLSGWIVVGVGVAIGAAAARLWFSSEEGRLRSAVEQARSEASTTAPLRLASDDAADAAARARAEREAITAWKREIELLKQRAEERARALRAAANGQAGGMVAAESEPSILNALVPHDRWRNVGRATPDDTVETALWTAAGGDVTGLAAMLELEPGARARAAALLAGLPAAIRAQCQTPEAFIALLGAGDLPLGDAMISPAEPSGETEATRRVQILGAGGKWRNATLRLQRVGDQWRVVVPESAVDRYAAKLRAPVGQ